MPHGRDLSVAGRLAPAGDARAVSNAGLEGRQRCVAQGRKLDWWASRFKAWRGRRSDDEILPGFGLRQQAGQDRQSCRHALPIRFMA